MLKMQVCMRYIIIFFKVSVMTLKKMTSEDCCGHGNSVHVCMEGFFTGDLETKAHEWVHSVPVMGLDGDLPCRGGYIPEYKLPLTV